MLSHFSLAFSLISPTHVAVKQAITITDLQPLANPGLKEGLHADIGKNPVGQRKANPSRGKGDCRI